jgi:hypothetical protein
MIPAPCAAFSIIRVAQSLRTPHVPDASTTECSAPFAGERHGTSRASRMQPIGKLRAKSNVSSGAFDPSGCRSCSQALSFLEFSRHFVDGNHSACAGGHRDFFRGSFSMTVRTGYALSSSFLPSAMATFRNQSPSDVSPAFMLVCSLEPAHQILSPVRPTCLRPAIDGITDLGRPLCSPVVWECPVFCLPICRRRTFYRSGLRARWAISPRSR